MSSRKGWDQRKKKSLRPLWKRRNLKRRSQRQRTVDEEVDFDVSDEDIEFEDEEDEDDVQPEPPEPEWQDIINGPLTAEGRFDVEPYTGDPRFPYAAVWPVRKPEKEILPQGLGIRAVYQHKRGHFTLVTRVVAASPGGLPKVIICYAQEALTKEQRQEPETMEDRRAPQFHEVEQTPSGP